MFHERSFTHGRLRRRTTWSIVALALVTLIGTACGGSEDSSGGVATLGGGRDEGSQHESDRMSFEEAAAKFAECMREQGVDVPDPTTDENGATGFAIDPETDVSGSRDDFEDADKKCRPILANAEPPEISDEDQQEMQESALAFAECMREHGIDVPDPHFDEEGSVSIDVGGPGSDMDPEDPSPAFEKAQEQCEDLLLTPGGDR